MELKWVDLSRIEFFTMVGRPVIVRIPMLFLYPFGL